MTQKSFAASEMELFQVVTRVLYDNCVQKTEMVYAFAETSDNQGSVLETATALYHEGRVPCIGISEIGNRNGYPGFDAWQEILLVAGIPEENIMPVPNLWGTLPPCTHTEARGLMCAVSGHHLQSIFITAPPFHMFRSFVNVVGELKMLKNRFLKVYCVPARTDDWQEEASHSQGTLRRARKDLLEDEFQRIQRYYEQGNLPSAGEVLAYLDARG